MDISGQGEEQSSAGPTSQETAQQDHGMAAQTSRQASQEDQAASRQSSTAMLESERQTACRGQINPIWQAS